MMIAIIGDSVVPASPRPNSELCLPAHRCVGELLMCGRHIALGGLIHLLPALQFPRGGSQDDVAPQGRRSNTCVGHQHGWELWQRHGGCLSAPIQTHTALLAVLHLGPRPLISFDGKP